MGRTYGKQSSKFLYVAPSVALALAALRRLELADVLHQRRHQQWSLRRQSAETFRLRHRQQ